MSKRSKIVLLIVSYVAYLTLFGVVVYTMWGEAIWVPFVIGLVVVLVPTLNMLPRRGQGSQERHGDEA
ncbi:hypothetical protein ACH9EU_08495 [Kocuria sp. M1R5S2]|uniref:hypothetical protein n=1 Tax=Kocuria rhizosphaerae TaxID=3376285 RepID=UPI003792D0E0